MTAARTTEVEGLAKAMWDDSAHVIEEASYMWLHRDFLPVFRLLIRKWKSRKKKK
jgi:hypothetical protein